MKRNHSIDLLRGLAVFLMFIVHTFHLSGNGKAYTQHNRILEAPLNFFNQIEPYIFALFLSVAGFCFSLAKRKQSKPESLKIKNFRRSFEFIAIGYLLFFIERGYQGWSGFLAAGPLFIIGASLALLELHHYFFYKNLTALWITILLILTSTFVAQDWLWYKKGISLIGLNAGNGAFFPHIVFAFIGYFLGTYYKAESGNWKLPPLFWWLGLVFSSAAAAAAACFSLTTATYDLPISYTLFERDYTSVGLFLYLWKKIQGLPVNTQTYTTTFWHYSTAGASLLVFPLIASYFLAFKGFQNNILLKKPLHFLTNTVLVLGRHSLFFYLCHLFFISLFFALGMFPSQAFYSWGLILFFTFGLPFIHKYMIKIYQYGFAFWKKHQTLQESNS